MSWLFGGGSGGKDDKPPLKFSDLYLGNQKPGENPLVPPSAPDDKLGHKMNPYSFDSEALERAAKAAKELEGNKNAKEIMEMIQQQQITKQKEMDIQMELLKQEAATKNDENRRRYMKEQAELEKQKAQYNDQLARKRNEDNLVMQQKMNEERIRKEQESLALQQKLNEEKLKKEEESLARQEALRRATFEHEIEQRQKLEINKAKAQVEAKTKQDRENKDILLEKVKINAQARQDTVLKSLGSVGYAMDLVLENKQKLTSVVLGAGGLIGSYFILKGGTRVGYNFLEARFVTPNLVQETSKVSLFDGLSHPIKTFKKLTRPKKDVMEGIVVDPKVEAKLRDIAIESKLSTRGSLLKSNILLYGPPGTGKTLFAKQLATFSGMDYAILSGGNFAGMGKHAIPEVEKVFRWCKASRKGVVLFIDEAESFLSVRTTMSEEMRNIFSAFLRETGTETDKFTIVFATNNPGLVDRAAFSRVSHMIEVPLPGYEERRRLIYQLFKKHILEEANSSKSRLTVGDFDYKDVCNKVAEMTEGMSGRNLSYLVIGWQKSALHREDGVCTREHILERTKQTLEDRERLDKWLETGEKFGDMWSQAVVNRSKEEFGDKKL